MYVAALKQPCKNRRLQDSRCRIPDTGYRLTINFIYLAILYYQPVLCVLKACSIIIPALLIMHLPMAVKAQSTPDSLKSLLSRQSNDTNKVNLLNKLAAVYAPINQDTMLQLAQQAMQLATQLHYSKGTANAFIQLSIAYRTRGDYSTALQQCLAGMHLYDSMRALAPLADANLVLARIYKDMSGANDTEEYIDRGIAYGRMGYSLFNSLHDTAGMVNSLSMEGILFRDKGKLFGKQHYYDTAFALYEKGIQLIDATGKGDEYRGKLYNNISQVYIEYKNDYRAALDYLLKAVAFNKNNHNTYSLSFNYGNISNAYLEMKDYTQSLLYARKMLAAAQEVKQPERMQNAYGSLYSAFRATGQTDSALRYYVLADKLDDSLTNISKTRQVMELQTKYETEKKQFEINRLQTEGSSKNKQIMLLAIAALLLALLAGWMVWLYRRVKKQRQQIAGQSARMETMMKELHHRVKNNLQVVSSLLSLQTYKLDDPGAISVLKESQQRVQAMSLIHQRLYKKETLTAVNMKEYICELAESLLASYGYHRDGFDLQVMVSNEMLDIDKALPIGLIINEMVTNALKYAYPTVTRPSLTIALTEDTQQLVCRVKDNGIGLDENKWKQKSNSFGKQLITALCKQLRAEQHIAVGDGTQFTLTIPKRVA